MTIQNGRYFGATHDSDAVVAALAGHFSPYQLEHLHRQVGKRRDKRRRKRKSAASLDVLVTMLARAAAEHPGAGEPSLPLPVVLHLYRAPDGDEPVRVHLVDEDRETTAIPQGAKVRLVDGMPAGAPGSFYFGLAPGAPVDRTVTLALGDSMVAPVLSVS